ncbi:MAG: chloride channel protein [Acidobacteria bacterium]|nr:MAG: chloride channel protein [Acidobacteriota bacterium]
MDQLLRIKRRWYRWELKATHLLDRLGLAENQKIFVLTILIGLTCGLAAVAVRLAINSTERQLIDRAVIWPSHWRIFWMLVIPTLGGALAGLLLQFVQEASGSGIPQVKAAYHLNYGRIPFKVVVGKFGLGTLCIGSGLSLGREGPTVQVCAGLASLIGRLTAVSRRNLMNLVPVGSAAGLAAAFNTPIAAVTFTLEEIIGDLSHKSIGAIIIAAVIASVIEQSILGAEALFTVPPYHLHHARELLFYALLGVLAAGVSVAFTEGLLRLRQRFLDWSIPAWLKPGIGGLIVGLIGIVALYGFEARGVFGIGYDVLSQALHGQLVFKVALVLVAAKLVATIVSYASGAAGGIFAPSLFIGGMLGSVVGAVEAYAMGLEPTQTMGAFALVGMGAVFAGIVRAPITSVLIIFEMTNNYTIILPLMIANAISYAAASWLSPQPVYEALLMQDHVHLPHRAPPHLLNKLTVASAMHRNVYTLHKYLTVEEAYQRVKEKEKELGYHGFPVVDGHGKMIGFITLNDLRRELGRGNGHKLLGEVAVKKVIHAHPDQTLDNALLKLGQREISQLPVVSRLDDGHVLGIITLRDIARAQAQLAREYGHIDRSLVSSRGD